MNIGEERKEIEVVPVDVPEKAPVEPAVEPAPVPEKEPVGV